jgi:hypothetical protein
LIERGTSAADPLDAMAERALADVKPFALRQISDGQIYSVILARSRDRDRRREGQRK